MSAPGAGSRQRVDERAYEASTLDREKIRRYARKVAESTRTAPAASLTYQGKVKETVTEPVRKGGFLGLGTRIEHVESVRYTDRTVTALGKHWVLDEQQWHIRRESASSYGRNEESSHSWSTCALLPDGRLVRVVVTEEEFLHVPTSGRGVDYRSERKHEVRDLDDREVLSLDRGMYTRESKQRQGQETITTWGARRDLGPLIRHAKGVGLNLALKAVLEGRSPLARR